MVAALGRSGFGREALSMELRHLLPLYESCVRQEAERPLPVLMVTGGADKTR